MSFYKEVPGRKTTLESTLKFDIEPKVGSTNPVTSDGVKGAIDGAVGDASAVLQEQIDDIAEKAGSGYIPKGEATVATLNALSGQENGDLYTMTDAGTLTLGSLAVVAGDTVAWDATNEVWYKAMDYAPRQYGTNEVHNLPTTITAFRTGDVIPVDGPSGTAKMSKDTLLELTAQNALAGNVAPEFDPTRTDTNPYLVGESVLYKGERYIVKNSHYGSWVAGDFEKCGIVSQNRPMSIGYLTFDYNQSTNEITIQNTNAIEVLNSPVRVGAMSTPYTYAIPNSGILHAAIIHNNALKIVKWGDVSADDILISIIHANSLSPKMFRVVSSFIPYRINGIANTPLYPAVTMFSQTGIICDNVNKKIKIDRNIVCQFPLANSITIPRNLEINYNFDVSSTTLYALTFNPKTSLLEIHPMSYKDNSQSLILVATIYASANDKVANAHSQVDVKIDFIDTSVKLTAVFGNGYINVDVVNRKLTVHRDLIIQVPETPYFKIIHDNSTFSYSDTQSTLNGIYYDVDSNELIVKTYASKSVYPCLATFSNITGFVSGLVRLTFNNFDTPIVPKGEYFGKKIKIKNYYTYYDLLTMTGVTYHQSLAISGDYALTLNYDSNGAKIKIYQFSTNSVVATLNLPSNDSFIPHCNTAVFGKDKHSVNSIVPLLYVSKWDYQSDKSCLVYDITESGGTYSVNLVQTITPNVSSSIIGEGDIDWVVDTDNDKLYAFAYKLQGSSLIETGNVEMIVAFDLPNTSSSSITLTDADVISNFTLPIINASQDKVYSNGRVYIIAGLGSVTIPKNNLYVVDLVNQTLASVVKLGNVTEPEGLSMYDGRLVFDFGDNILRQFVFD